MTKLGVGKLTSDSTMCSVLSDAVTEDASLPRYALPLP